MEEYKRSITRVRISVEWIFGDIINYSKFLDLKRRSEDSFKLSKEDLYSLRFSVQCIHLLYGNTTPHFLTKCLNPFKSIFTKINITFLALCMKKGRTPPMLLNNLNKYYFYLEDSLWGGAEGGGRGVGVLGGILGICKV